MFLRLSSQHRVRSNPGASVRSWVYVFLGIFLPTQHAAAFTQFTDVTQQAGVSYLQWKAPPVSPEALRMTGGAAAGDVDGDGYPDLFVTRYDGTDILFRNNGQGGFEDISQAAGFRFATRTNGVAMGDIDNDSDLDIYVTSVDDTRHYLYLNDGRGHFTEEALQRNAGIYTVSPHYGMSPAFGDYDRDGYLDLHVTEWGNRDYQPPSLWSHMRLLRNRGANAPGRFVDTTLAAGVYLDDAGGYGPLDSMEGVWGFTPTFADFDRDGWVDLAVAGDFHTSRLFWNQGDGTFQAAPGPFSAHPSGLGTDENGMGSAIADFNGDGLLDWFVSSIYETTPTCGGAVRCHWDSSGNRLYLNNGDRTFSDVTDRAGVRDGGWGWGSTFFDYDNDGDLDLAMTNGMVTISPLSAKFAHDATRLWQNDGSGVFTEVAHQVGLTDTDSGKGLLTFDYDLDGDLDLFIVNNAGTPKLYRNDTIGQAYLKVQTRGVLSNRDGMGAFVTLQADPGGPLQTRYITGGSNFLAQSELTAHFGLGVRDQPIHALTIDWPSGQQQRFNDVMLNSTLVAVEPVPEPQSLMALLFACGMMLRFRSRS